MEQVAHGVNEDGLGFLPRKRQNYRTFMERNLKPVVVGLTHGVQPFRHALRIAVLAAGADFGTAGYRIPGRIGPFDCRFCHIWVSTPLLR